LKISGEDVSVRNGEFLVNGAAVTNNTFGDAASAVKAFHKWRTEQLSLISEYDSESGFTGLKLG
jgi:hypothetical protein